jgi:hypothetical protein
MPTNWIDEARLAYLRHEAYETAAEQLWVRTLREYAGGEHPTYLTDRQQEFIGLKPRRAKGATTSTVSHGDKLYSHNLCSLVIDTVVERLHVTGFAPADEKDAAAAALAELATQWWDENRMDAGQDELHEAACRDEEAFIIVHWDFDEMRPRWTLNTRSDGTQGMTLHRDPVTNAPTYAAKRWQENGKTRVTLYFPDRVEKWISGSGGKVNIGGVETALGFEPYKDMPDEPWPLWWTMNDQQGGDPLGLAVIGFLNPGGSEIAQLLSIQDALNKADIDLLAAQDVSGFRILWAAGWKAQIGSDGAEEAVTISPAKLIRLADPQAKLDAIEPANLESMIRVSKYWIESAAGVTRTPQYLFEALGADSPSGESLKQREIGLISKVERKQRVFGNAWEDVVALSGRLWAKYRPGDATPPARLQTQWKSAAIENEKEKMDIAEQKIRLGVPAERALMEIGYDPEEAASFVEEKDARDAERMEREGNIGERLLKGFETGR